jgi:hypothetical protein
VNRYQLSLIVTVCLAAMLHAGSAPGPVPTSQPADRFYFERCPECDRLLGTRGDPIEKYYDARQVRFCQAECATEFEADLSASYRRLDARQKIDQLPLYPLGTCVVSDVILPNEPVDFIFNNRLIRVAGEAEKTSFLADPKPYWDKLDSATIAHQARRYWVAKCPEQGAALDLPNDEQFTVVVAQRIVRVCCEECHDRVRERPSQYLPLIDNALRNPPAWFVASTQPATKPAR